MNDWRIKWEEYRRERLERRQKRLTDCFSNSRNSRRIEKRRRELVAFVESEAEALRRTPQSDERWEAFPI